MKDESPPPSAPPRELAGKTVRELGDDALLDCLEGAVTRRDLQDDDAQRRIDEYRAEIQRRLAATADRGVPDLLALLDRLEKAEAAKEAAEKDAMAFSAALCEDPQSHPNGNMVCGTIRKLEAERDALAARLDAAERQKDALRATCTGMADRLDEYRNELRTDGLYRSAGNIRRIEQTLRLAARSATDGTPGNDAAPT